MSTERALTPEERAREAISALYKGEELLIVINNTPGVVPIGFRPEDGRGEEIVRSHLPQVLTDLAPREVWLRANDFRQAVKKGWLRVIDIEEHDRLMAQEREKQARLRRLAALDEGKEKEPSRYDAVRRPVSELDEARTPPSEMDIDENTATIVPAQDNAQNARANISQENFEKYEKVLDKPPPDPEIPAGRASKAESLVDRISTRSIKPLDAAVELDRDADLYSDDDLTYIAQRADYQSVKRVAREVLAKRAEAAA